MHIYQPGASFVASAAPIMQIKPEICSTLIGFTMEKYARDDCTGIMMRSWEQKFASDCKHSNFRRNFEISEDFFKGNIFEDNILPHGLLRLWRGAIQLLIFKVACKQNSNHLIALKM